MIDIYFDNNYGKLYEKAEKGTAKVFTFKSNLGAVQNQFIQREIPLRIDGEKYYDVITPYGYGGPLIMEDRGDRRALVSQYQESLSKYCAANRIVTEFVRFHPIVPNAQDFIEVYTVNNIRKTVGTNLRDYDEPVASEFSRSCRRNIRRGLRAGVTYRVFPKPDISAMRDFKRIYYSTMARNQAADYYYFDDEYFENCLHFFGDCILLVEALYSNKVIAAGLYFISNGIMHAHLSGTCSRYLHLSPAYILRYAATLWGKRNDYHLIHHGGGRSNSPDDSLYLFKKQFGKTTEFDFYVGKKVWNAEIYGALCRMAGVDGAATDYFPAYRVSGPAT